MDPIEVQAPMQAVVPGPMPHKVQDLIRAAVAVITAEAAVTAVAVVVTAAVLPVEAPAVAAVQVIEDNEVQYIR